MRLAGCAASGLARSARWRDYARDRPHYGLAWVTPTDQTLAISECSVGNLRTLTSPRVHPVQHEPTKAQLIREFSLWLDGKRGLTENSMPSSGSILAKKRL